MGEKVDRGGLDTTPRPLFGATARAMLPKLTKHILSPMGVVFYEVRSPPLTINLMTMSSVFVIAHEGLYSIAGIRPCCSWGCFIIEICPVVHGVVLYGRLP